MTSSMILGKISRTNLKAPPRHQLLEVNVISAQSLDKDFDAYQLYAVVSAYLDDQQPTQITRTSRNEAVWNEQFVVRVDDAFIQSETSAMTVSICVVRTVAGFRRDRLLGSTRIVLSTFLNHSRQNVALHIRRAKTLEPCGILNAAISVLGFGHGTPEFENLFGSDRKITSVPQSCSMRFDSKHKLDEDIEYAFTQQRRIVDKSGPIEMERKQEQAEQETLVSKIEQWKVDLSLDDSSMENKKRIDKRKSQINVRRSRFYFCGGGMKSEEEM